jgi:phage major head subunit gpT-like protein
MSAQGLGSRAIIGRFYSTLAAMTPGWVNLIGFEQRSDQESETYKWLGQIPALREWVGGRHAKGFTENGLTVINKEFEATLEVLKREMRRDKTGQLMIRVSEMARRAATHDASLISTLINNGGTGVCYDGEFFFDTDHKEGKNTTNQSNSLSIDISALAVTNHGSTTAPSVGEARECITQAIAAQLAFKDNENEPMNEDARSFLVMTPTTGIWSACRAAVGLPMVDSGEANVLVAIQNVDGYSISVAMNPRLTATDAFYVFRTDAFVKPFIIQKEIDLEMSAIAEGSELEFNENKHRYGVYKSGNCAYGMWQQAVKVTMT